jgi:hypothetical protein
LIDRQTEVHANPSPSGYQSLKVLVPLRALNVVIDGADVGKIAVADILP